MTFNTRFFLVCCVSLLTAGAVMAQFDADTVPLGLVHTINPYGIAAAPPTGGTTPVGPMNYAGGALINVPNVYYIWYGNWNQTNGSDNPAGQQILRDFATGISNSNYYKINNTYSTNGYNITGAVNYAGETTVPGSRLPLLTNRGVLNQVNAAITSGALPYDAAGVYFVLTSSNINNPGFCTSYCGWHNSGTISTGQKVRYSFVGNANRCLSSCAIQSVGPNNNAGVDGMVSVVAHELEESATDADPPTGWTASSGAENADLCAWTFGTSTALPNGSFYNVTLGSRFFLIQRNVKRQIPGPNGVADYCVMQ